MSAIDSINSHSPTLYASPKAIESDKVSEIGHAAIEKLNVTYYQKGRLASVEMSEKDPYKRGFQHGKTFMPQIQGIYHFIGKETKDETSLQRAKKLETNIPFDMKKEFQGIADGADVDYYDVVFMHVLYDINPENFACTAMAREFSPENDEKRIAAANHSLRHGVGIATDYSKQIRKNILQEEVADNKKPMDPIAAANVRGTIQSIVFDTENSSFQLAVHESYAAFGIFTDFSPHTDSKPFPDRGIQLQRNLDMLYFKQLGLNTLVINRNFGKNHNTLITFPGYIGALSGINDKGLALAACARSDDTYYNESGIPNTLLFNMMLEECSTVEEAKHFLSNHEHGNTMNLIVADKISAYNLELDRGKEVRVEGSLPDSPHPWR